MSAWNKKEICGGDGFPGADFKFWERRNLKIWGLAVLSMLCGCAGPLLEVRPQEGGINLLINGDFESHVAAFAGWEPWEDGYEIGEGRRSSGAVYCRSAKPLRRGIGQRLVLDQECPLPLLVSGWSKAIEVSGGRYSEYSLYVDLIYDDGEEVWGQHAPFDTGTHDWQEGRLLIRPTRPIRELSVYGLFRGHTGEAWFDDFALYEWGGEGMAVFDGVAVVQKEQRTVDRTGTMFATQDNFTLGYDRERGQVTRVQVDGRELGGDTPGGFMVRDVARNSGFYGFENGECKFLDLRISAEIEAFADYVKISGMVENTDVGFRVDIEHDANTYETRVEAENSSLRERAITLVFALPIEAVGWNWHEDVRHSRSIQAGQEYVNAVHIGTGSTGDLSLYPWAMIDDGEAGLMLGIDMGQPAQYRLGYSGGTGYFFIAYDFGLTSETEGFPHGAPFSFVVARAGPEWGFRAATKRYYGIFPEAFAKRSSEQGIWMPFTDVSTVAGWGDFGFKYHEGINNVPFDDEADVLSFRYTEPSTWWMRMPEEVPRTHEGVMEVLKKKAEEGDRRARAIEVSGSHDTQERLQYQIRKEPWCDGAVFSSNPSPYLPDESEAQMNWNEEVRERLYGADSEGEQDGEYLDSVEGYVTATENFRRDHFRHARVPLTFSALSKRPVIHKAFSVWEFSTWLGGQVRGMDKLLFGNAVPDRFAFLVSAFDIMGTESNWLHEEGWKPPADGWFNFRRAMCYQKPYLLLMNTDYDRLVPELVEKYFQRCLFYGFFPSMFSHNAAENPYWKTPRWYERDRQLFKRYIPYIKQVAEAGWEPITGARSENPQVWVERFGMVEGGEVFITLFNASSETQVTRVWIPQEILTPGIVVELLSGEQMVIQKNAWGASLGVTLAPEQVRVLAVRP